MPEVPQTVFYFDADRPGFEDLGKPDGVTHWDEDILKDVLWGMNPRQVFRKSVDTSEASMSVSGDPVRRPFPTTGERQTRRHSIRAAIWLQ